MSINYSLSEEDADTIIHLITWVDEYSLTDDEQKRMINVLLKASGQPED